MTTTIEQLKETIRKLRQGHKTRVDGIKSNTTLTGQAQVDLVASAQEAYNRQRSELLDKLETAIATERQRLTDRAFQPAAHQAAEFRGALAQLASLKSPDEFKRLLSLAITTGDTLLLKAIAVSEFTSNPDGAYGTLVTVGKHVKEVQALVDFEASEGRLRSPQQMIAASMDLGGGNDNMDSLRQARPVEQRAKGALNVLNE